MRFVSVFGIFNQVKSFFETLDLFLKLGSGIYVLRCRFWIIFLFFGMKSGIELDWFKICLSIIESTCVRSWSVHVITLSRLSEYVELFNLFLSFGVHTDKTWVMNVRILRFQTVRRGSVESVFEMYDGFEIFWFFSGRGEGGVWSLDESVC